MRKINIGINHDKGNLVYYENGIKDNLYFNIQPKEKIEILIEPHILFISTSYWLGLLGDHFQSCKDHQEIFSLIHFNGNQTITKFFIQACTRSLTKRQITTEDKKAQFKTSGVLKLRLQCSLKTIYNIINLLPKFIKNSKRQAR